MYSFLILFPACLGTVTRQKLCMRDSNTVFHKVSGKKSWASFMWFSSLALQRSLLTNLRCWVHKMHSTFPGNLQMAAKMWGGELWTVTRNHQSVNNEQLQNMRGWDAREKTGHRDQVKNPQNHEMLCGIQSPAPLSFYRLCMFQDGVFIKWPELFFLSPGYTSLTENTFTFHNCAKWYNFIC